MKKIISILILVVIVFTCFAFHVSALDESSFAKEDAEALFKDAYNRLALIYNVDYKNNPEFLTNYDKIKGDSALSANDRTPEKYHFKENTKGEKFLYERYYQLVTDERFDTLAECKKFICDVFTAEMYEKINNIKSQSTADKTSYELFRDSNGAYEDHVGSFTSVPAGSVMHNCEVRDFPPNMGNAGAGMKLTKIESFQLVGSDKAILNVKANYGYSSDIPISGKEVEKSLTVEFIKSESGWRISGGSFFDMLLNEYSPDNPSTGSPSAIYLALAGAAILCALPVVKRKRRRI